MFGLVFFPFQTTLGQLLSTNLTTNYFMLHCLVVQQLLVYQILSVQMVIQQFTGVGAAKMMTSQFGAEVKVCL